MHTRRLKTLESEGSDNVKALGVIAAREPAWRAKLRKAYADHVGADFVFPVVFLNIKRIHLEACRAMSFLSRMIVLVGMLSLFHA